MQQAEINFISALAALIIAITPALVAIVYSQSKRLDSQGKKISDLQDGGVEKKIDSKLREYSLITPVLTAAPPITAAPIITAAPPITEPAAAPIHADTLPITEGIDE